MAAVVIAASVVNGSMSESAPMAVVLPTPKPPETTILTGTGGGAADVPGTWSAEDGPPCHGRSERRDTLHQPLQEVDVVGGSHGRGRARLQEAVPDQVRHEHPRHA